MDICRSLTYSFNFENLKILPQQLEVIFSPIKFYKKIYFHGKYVQNFVISFFTLTYVLLDELIPFHGKNFAPRSIKKESYRYPHCIFQSVFALNTRKVKSH